MHYYGALSPLRDLVLLKEIKPDSLNELILHAADKVSMTVVGQPYRERHTERNTEQINP